MKEVYGKALKLKEIGQMYEEIEKLVNDLDSKSLIDIMNRAEIFSKSKDNIYEILDYMNIILYNTRKIHCIKIVEETKKRLLSNSNFDMTIDNLLIKIWEEINEKYNRS